VAVAGPAAWLLLQASPADALVTEAWNVMRNGDPVGLRDLLDNALSTHGGSFAMLVASDPGPVVLLSGQVTAVVAGADGSWCLRCPDGVVSARYRLDGRSSSVWLNRGESAVTAHVPIGSGVAQADAVAVTWDPDSSGTSPSQTSLPPPEASDRPRSADPSATLRPSELQPEISDVDGAVSEAVVPEPEAVAQAAVVSGAGGVPGEPIGPRSQQAAPPVLAPTDGATADGTYDHLFGRTVNRKVEDAAVRVDEVGVTESATAGPAGTGSPTVDLPAAGPGGADGDDDASDDAAMSEPTIAVPAVGTTPGPVDAVAPLPRLDAVAPPPPASGGHSASIAAGEAETLSLSRGANATPGAARQGRSGGLIDVVPGAGPSQSAGPAAVDPPPAPAVASSENDLELTVDRAAHAALLARLAAPGGFVPAVPVVQAVRCPSQHLNPAHAGACRVCGLGIPEQTPQGVPRPVLGRLRLSTGDDVVLDRGVRMGRSPTDSDGPGRDRPHLVKLPSPDQAISRDHVEVTLDGWHVVVSDLDSTNGTLVTLPGRQSQRLRPGEKVMIEPGTVVSLADEVSFIFEAG